MQSKQSTPIMINGIHINATLDTSAKTGLVCLLNNAPLLAIANHSSHAVPPEYLTRLQSDIQTIAFTFGNLLTELAFAVADDDNEHISQDSFYQFAQVVGELLPFLTTLADNLNSPITYPILNQLA